MSDTRIAAAVALLGALAYVAFGWGTETVYDYYGRLAQAFVQGRWWLSEAPPWLNELLSCGPERWCVAYPPLPAVLTAPFLGLGSAGFAQSIMARIAGGASAGFLYLGLRCYGAPRSVSLTGAALSAFGTTLLFSSVDGRAWYAAHSVAMLFGSVAFWLAARGGPSWAVGSAIGLAALARLPFAATFPALALLASRKGNEPYLRSLVWVIVGGMPFAAAYVGYDLLRWGSVFDLGYSRLAEGDVFFDHGVFSLEYLPRHVYAIFLEPPDLVSNTPWFLRPRFIGMSLFLTTPAFLFVFSGLRDAARSAVVAATAIAAGLALLPDVLHATVGFQQFGYRFSLDAQPFLVALALWGDGALGAAWARRPSGLLLGAGLISIVVNVFAVIAIVRFGYWQ